MLGLREDGRGSVWSTRAFDGIKDLHNAPETMRKDKCSDQVAVGMIGLGKMHTIAANSRLVSVDGKKSPVAGGLVKPRYDSSFTPAGSTTPMSFRSNNIPRGR